jgi:hypothetical protein
VHKRNQQVEAPTRSAAGVLGPIQGLSQPYAGFPGMAVSPGGDAVAVWAERPTSEVSWRVRAAKGP